MVRRGPRQQHRVLEHEREVERVLPRLLRRQCRTRETCPLVGAIRSATTRSKVDLPQPDGPSRRQELAALDVENEMFSSAVTVRRSVTKRTDTLRHATALASARAGGAAQARDVAAPA